MSGWVKWEKDLEKDPRMIRLVRELKRVSVTQALPERIWVSLACGGLLRLWSYADSHIRSDDVLDLSPADIDDMLGIENFCASMPEDWLLDNGDGTVTLPNFQEHNGIVAKKKALGQKRTESHRSRARNAEQSKSVTGALPDQTRPDQTNKKIDVPSGTVVEKSDGEKISESVERVFAHWQAVHEHPQAKLDDKRRALIRKALKNYTETQLKDSISGFKKSPHHMGTDPRSSGTKYDQIDLFLRDSKHVDMGLAFLANPPRQAQAAGSIQADQRREANEREMAGLRAEAKRDGFRDPFNHEGIELYRTALKNFQGHLARGAATKLFGHDSPLKAVS